MRKSLNVAVRLENTTPGHNKFWTIFIHLRVVKLTWGPIGSWTKEIKKTFDTHEEALDFVNRKIDSKLRRGYVIA